MDRCKTRYPIVLVHGTGFRDLRRPVYWGRIPKALQQRGAKLCYGLQDCWASTATNAAALKERVARILDETGAEKVNMIGHSKGGLEIRMLASSLGMGSSIASVTTIATPHYGSKTIDRLLEAPRGFFNIAAFAVNNWIHLLGDREPDFLAVCNDLSTPHAARFNLDNPDHPDVFYQSYACVMRCPFSDVNLFMANAVVGLFEGPNDGLVSVRSAMWGENSAVLRSAGRRGISHVDAIDFRRARLSRRQREGYVSDIVDVYVAIVEDLKKRGL